MPNLVVGRFVVGYNLEWQGVRVLIALFCTMGCRQEAVALGAGEVLGPRKLRLSSVAYLFDGVLVTAPSLAQLRAVNPSFVSLRYSNPRGIQMRPSQSEQPVDNAAGVFTLAVVCAVFDSTLYEDRASDILLAGRI